MLDLGGPAATTRDILGLSSGPSLIVVLGYSVASTRTFRGLLEGSQSILNLWRVSMWHHIGGILQERALLWGSGAALAEFFAVKRLFGPHYCLLGFRWLVRICT